jgi:hypothetical protein
MGLVWSYSMLGSDNLSCPLHVQIKAADKICLHYIRYSKIPSRVLPI